jgi:hypothetical protein
MKILIVGSGAVGQVFGLALQEAGVELALYDRPETVEKLRHAFSAGGLRLYQMPGSRRQAPSIRLLKEYHVVDDVNACRDFAPDQIWFTVPSPAYYTEWFRKFVQSVPSHRVVCFIPEGGRPEFIPADSPVDRFVFGGTTFMAWQGDLNGRPEEADSVHFYRSPMGIPLAGTETACQPVKEVLKNAGFAASISGPDTHMQAAVTAGMTAFVTGLELAGWSLRGFRKSPWRIQSAHAGQEAILSQVQKAGLIPRLLAGTLSSPGGFYFIAWTLPFLFPFDIQKYLQYHYIKTRNQSLTLLDMFEQDCLKIGRSAQNLRLLIQALLNSPVD